MARESESSQEGVDRTLLAGTFAGAEVPSTAAPPPAPGEKVCCCCGMNVAGQKRMKDSGGIYWCYECGMADQKFKKDGVGMQCPDCNQSFPPQQMPRYDETRVCVTCRDKRVGRSKRQAAREAAAREEALLEAERRKRIFIVVGIVGAIVVLWILKVVLS